MPQFFLNHVRLSSLLPMHVVLVGLTCGLYHAYCVYMHALNEIEAWYWYCIPIAAWNFTHGAILVFTFPGGKPPRNVDFQSKR